MAHVGHSSACAQLRVVYLTRRVMRMNNTKCASNLVGAEGLLAAIFDESARPSLRWLQKMNKARVIPSYKIGSLRLYSVPEVQHALAQNFKLEARQP